jgi:hypothetical protein
MPLDLRGRHFRQAQAREVVMVRISLVDDTTLKDATS